jgi:hypothetical protein
MPYFYVLCVTKGTSNSGAAKINVTAVAYYVKWMKKKEKTSIPRQKMALQLILPNCKIA